MARVLLIGSGPLPDPTARHTAFPQLRLAHFHDTLATDHTLRTISLHNNPAPDNPEGPFAGTFSVQPSKARWLDRLRKLASEAEIIVSAGPHLPGEAACLIAEDRPVWADLPGDPFAELQAVALAPDAALSPTRIASAHSAALTVLSRADRISVISERQRLALLGQLGVLDRLRIGPPGGIGEVVPIGYHSDLAPQSPRHRTPSAPLVIALCGGFNTWLDDQALTTALQHALDAIPTLKIICTGGGIEGHYTAGFERFDRWRRTSPHADRISVCGWVPHESLASILSEAHVGMYLDRPGCEALLGSRTRVHLFTWLGLEVLGTPGSELTQQLADADLLLPAADTPEQIAEQIIQLSRSGSDGQRAAGASRWLSQRFSPEQTTLPLRRWALSPERAPAASGLDVLIEENSRLREALRAVHRSPTWQMLDRINRAGRRLLGSQD